ncbi:MAG: hypothetical protein HOP02_10815 [Methylococcaceae bacterium]|nr:hypothetical protein [Methylococcaceae bacterium]
MKNELQTLQMGDFTDAEVAKCERLLNSINLEQLPHQFGLSRSKQAQQNFEGLTGLLAESLDNRLGSLITELLKQLPNASPENPNWLQRQLGQTLVNSLRYENAKKRIDRLLQEGEVAATRLEQQLSEMVKQQTQLKLEVAQLRLHVAAGRLYLQRHLPPATDTESLDFDKPIERFARRLTNLTALLASHEMTATQLDLVYAQTVNLLERFYESSRVLFPIWQEHALALLLNGGNTAVKIRLVQYAFNALVKKSS